jgi:hypothetical protein
MSPHPRRRALWQELAEHPQGGAPMPLPPDEWADRPPA